MDPQRHSLLLFFLALFLCGVILAAKEVRRRCDAGRLDPKRQSLVDTYAIRH